MKVLLQYLNSGETKIEEIPFPVLKKNSCIIQSTCSLISTGTEKMMLNFSKSNLLEKALQQPDKVKEVLQKIQHDGLSSTIEAVKSKLDTPVQLGYSNVGRILESGTDEFKINDRVVSNGPHAEIVQINKQLICKIPEALSDEEASFAFVAAIGLQSIRLLDPKMGDIIAVIGLGLIGNLTAQLLLSNGCKVIAFDKSKEAVDLAQSMGITAFVYDKNNMDSTYSFYLNEKGADGVIITASSDEDLFNSAAIISRQRAKIILTGVIDHQFNRDLFYKKELSIQVSCSYGPGRYDKNYEEKGYDYPIGLVRWTEKRNVECVLDLLAENKINVKPLIKNRIKFGQDLIKAYQHFETLNGANIIEYEDRPIVKQKTLIVDANLIETKNTNIGLIGLGNFARKIILPQLQKYNKLPSVICSSQTNAIDTVKKYKLGKLTTDKRELIHDPNINLIFIANQHHQHGNLVSEILSIGKSVYVEKPLCISMDELNKITEIYLQHASNVRLIVGYNRRFSKFTEAIKEKLLGNEHLTQIIYTINAGFISKDHWINDPEIGGGRILGEVCHFIDWCNFTLGAEVESVYANSIRPEHESISDNVSITLRYTNGSQAVIHYLTNGNKKYPKENIKLFSAGQILELDNFKILKTNQSFINTIKLTQQDKGFDKQFQMIKSKLDYFDKAYTMQILHVSKVNFAVLESLKHNTVINLNEF